MTQAILGGFLIGVGDIALMSVTGQYMGALLFCVALQCIIFFGLPLYTGRIGKAPWEKEWAWYILTLIFNVVGASLAVWLFTLLNPDSMTLIRAMADAKFGDANYLAMFVAGVLCNVLIHLACLSNNSIIVILCVMTFILCGFEHSIAAVPYAVLTFNLKYMLGWLFILLGNTVGAIATEFMLRFMRTENQANQQLDQGSTEEVVPPIPEGMKPIAVENEVDPDDLNVDNFEEG